MRRYSLSLAVFCAACAIGGALSLNGWLVISGCAGALINLLSFAGFE
jgi:hypothetical protein